MKKTAKIVMLVVSFLSIQSAFAQDQDPSQSLKSTGKAALLEGRNCMIGSQLLPLLNDFHSVEIAGALATSALPSQKARALSFAKDAENMADYQQRYVSSGCVDAVREAGKFASAARTKFVDAVTEATKKTSQGIASGILSE